LTVTPAPSHLHNLPQRHLSRHASANITSTAAAVTGTNQMLRQSWAVPAALAYACTTRPLTMAAMN
jgi:hypothetical protein